MKRVSLAATLALTACTLRSNLPIVSTESSPPAATTAPARPASPPPARDAEPTACVEELGADASSDFATATPLAAGTLVGCFTPGDRVDVFALRAPDVRGASYFRLDLEGSPDHQFGVKIHNADREQIRSHYLSKSERKSLFVSVAPSSVIYLKLQSNNTSAQTPRGYRIEVSVNSLDDADEPNNAMEYAVPLAFGEPREGYLAPVLNDATHGDDWYRVEATEPGTLSLVVSGVPTELVAQVEVVDADRNRLVRRYGRNAGATVRMEVELRSAGSYFVRVAPQIQSGEYASFELPQFLRARYQIAASMR